MPLKTTLEKLTKIYFLAAAITNTTICNFLRITHKDASD